MNDEYGKIKALNGDTISVGGFRKDNTVSTHYFKIPSIDGFSLRYASSDYAAQDKMHYVYIILELIIKGTLHEIFISLETTDINGKLSDKQTERSEKIIKDAEDTLKQVFIGK